MQDELDESWKAKKNILSSGKVIVLPPSVTADDCHILNQGVEPSAVAADETLVKYALATMGRS